jgi:hypothetical protein
VRRFERDKEGPVTATTLEDGSLRVRIAAAEVGPEEIAELKRMIGEAGERAAVSLVVDLSELRRPSAALIAFLAEASHRYLPGQSRFVIVTGSPDVRSALELAGLRDEVRAGDRA